MGDYEDEQAKLQKMMDEFLSDDEPEPFSAGSSEEFSPYSDSDSSWFEEAQRRKRKIGQGKKDKKKPTSRNDNLPGRSNVDETIDEVIATYLCEDESDEEDSDERREITWGPVTGLSMKTFDFQVHSVGIKDTLYETHITNSPADFVSLFIDDALLQHIATETNRYASQKTSAVVGKSSRLKAWSDTNPNELRRFFAIIIWMGLSKYPRMSDYWCKKVIYKSKISSIMSRNRYELILRMIHFNDNESPTMIQGDRLHKLTSLITKLKDKYKEYYTPGESVCIDETIVPFRGRLSFKQYIKNKRHKFGIKLFKLCCEKGYTYDLSVYCGKESSPNQSVPSKIVMSLMDNLLDVGRVLYTDNYYTSVELAHQLLNRNTHLVGTLRSNRKHNSKDVVSKVLKKGEYYAEESNSGVVILKWKDKRDVLTLSTKHTNTVSTVQRKRSEVDKPDIIIDYNDSKAFIDLSDQIKSYSSPLRKGIKWYRKLAFELLFGTTIVNAYILHRTVTQANISITEFREQIVEELLDLKEDKEKRTKVPESDVSHCLKEVASKDRRRCVTCYETNSSTSGRAAAQKSTSRSRFRCIQCNKFYCLACFSKVHMITKQ